MWQWELRDVKLLPKSLRLEATLLRRRARHVGDRLNAVVNAHRALTLLQEGKRYAPSKFAKVLETLAKAKTLEQVEAEAADARATTAAKQNKVAMSAEEKQRDADSKEAEKERLRQEREAAKEQARKAKEEERARVVAEKEAEKERKLKEKEAEKERKMKEVEASKIVKKTGFKDADSLSKTANKFKVRIGFYEGGGGRSFWHAWGACSNQQILRFVFFKYRITIITAHTFDGVLHCRAFSSRRLHPRQDPPFTLTFSPAPLPLLPCPPRTRILPHPMEGMSQLSLLRRLRVHSSVASSSLPMSIWSLNLPNL